MNSPDQSTGQTSPTSTVDQPAASVGSPTYTALTPEELEAAIRAAGALVEKHQNAGHRQKAREAFAEVRRLVALRSADTVRAMEEERGLL